MWTPSQRRGDDNQEEQENDREHCNLQSPIHSYAPRPGRTAMTAARLDGAYALRGGLALLGTNRFALLAANRFFTDF